MAVAAHVDGQPLRAGVDDGRADAVQTAGHLVAGVLAAELAAGVQDGIDDGDGGQTGIGLDVHGDAAAVVGDLNDVILDLDLNVVAVAGQRFVDGVVHDLVDQMMQAALTGGADIHAGRLRTASRPFRTWISLALYSWSVAVSTLVLVMISSAISFLPVMGWYFFNVKAGSIVVLPHKWAVFQAGISVRRSSLFFMAALDSSER